MELFKKLFQKGKLNMSISKIDIYKVKKTKCFFLRIGPP